MEHIKIYNHKIKLLALLILIVFNSCTDKKMVATHSSYNFSNDELLNLCQNLKVSQRNSFHLKDSFYHRMYSSTIFSVNRKKYLEPISGSILKEKYISDAHFISDKEIILSNYNGNCLVLNENGDVKINYNIQSKINKFYRNKKNSINIFETPKNLLFFNDKGKKLNDIKLQKNCYFAINQNGDLIVVSDKKRNVHLYDKLGNKIRRITNVNETINGIYFLESIDTKIAIEGETHIRLLNLKGNEIGRVKTKNKDIISIQSGLDYKNEFSLFTMYKDGNFYRYTENLTNETLFKLRNSELVKVIYDDKRKVWICLNQSGVVEIRGLNKNELLQSKCDFEITRFSYDYESGTVFLIGLDEIMQWKPFSIEIPYFNHLEVNAINFTSDGTYLFSFSSERQTVKIKKRLGLSYIDHSTYSDVIDAFINNKDNLVLIKKGKGEILNIETKEILSSFKLSLNSLEIKVNQEQKFILSNESTSLGLTTNVFLRDFNGKTITEFGKLTGGRVDLSSDGKFILLIEYRKIRVYNKEGNLLNTIKLKDGSTTYSFMNNSQNYIHYVVNNYEKIIDFEGNIISKKEFNSSLISNIRYKKNKDYYFYKDKTENGDVNEVGGKTLYEIIYYIKKRNPLNQHVTTMRFNNIMLKNWAISNDEHFLMFIDKDSPSKVFWFNFKSVCN